MLRSFAFVKTHRKRPFTSLPSKSFAKVGLCDYQTVLRILISATPELWLDGIRPDVYTVFEGEPVAIEIWVGHKADDGKIAIYNERQLAAVEIDLSDYRDDDNLTADRIKRLVLYLAQRAWLSPPAEVRHRLEAEAAEQNGSDCSKSKTAASQ